MSRRRWLVALAIAAGIGGVAGHGLGRAFLARGGAATDSREVVWAIDLLEKGDEALFARQLDFLAIVAVHAEAMDRLMPGVDRLIEHLFVEGLDRSRANQLAAAIGATLDALGDGPLCAARRRRLAQRPR
ncbi:MAG: hypothetical protein U1F36_16045 [Planctomycetota bacterium]